MTLEQQLSSLQNEVTNYYQVEIQNLQANVQEEQEKYVTLHKTNTSLHHNLELLEKNMLFAQEEAQNKIEQVQSELKDKVQSLQIAEEKIKSISQSLQQYQQREQEALQIREVLVVEVAKLQKEIKKYEQLAYEKQLIDQQNQVNQLQSSLNQLEEEKKLTLNEKYELKSKINYLSYLLKKEYADKSILESVKIQLEQDLHQLAAEKQELFIGFKQLIQMTKNMMVNAKQMKAKLSQTEGELDEMYKNRHNIHSALLDSLHEERVKNSMHKSIFSVNARMVDRQSAPTAAVNTTVSSGNGYQRQSNQPQLGEFSQPESDDRWFNNPQFRVKVTKDTKIYISLML
jgi:chromosome segregation ATPase